MRRRPGAVVIVVSVSEEPEFETGVAGASARREHGRRRIDREQRVRDKHPRTATLRLAFAAAPTHETAWARGAAGEQRVAAALAKHLKPGVVVLHDRRIPGSRANIDHIAIAPSGVWVIDAKRYAGKVAVTRPLLGAARLTIAGRDRSALITGLANQVALVQTATAGLGHDVAVNGALCFVDAELPLFGTLTFDGYALLHPRALTRRINATGPLDDSQVLAIAGALAQRFRAA